MQTKPFRTLGTFAVLGLTIGLTQADEPSEKGKRKGGDPVKHAQAMIERLDRDGNGTISREEFAAGPFAAKAKEKGADINKFFDARDKNKDGQLDLEELSTRPEGRGKGRPDGEGPRRRPDGEGPRRERPDGEGDAKEAPKAPEAPKTEGQ